MPSGTADTFMPDQPPSSQQKRRIRTRWRFALHILAGCMLVSAFIVGFSLDFATARWLAPLLGYGAAEIALVGLLFTLPDEIKERLGGSSDWVTRLGVVSVYVALLCSMGCILPPLLLSLGFAPNLLNVQALGGLNIWMLLWAVFFGGALVGGALVLIAYATAIGAQQSRELRAQQPRHS